MCNFIIKNVVGDVGVAQSPRHCKIYSGEIIAGNKFKEDKGLVD